PSVHAELISPVGPVRRSRRSRPDSRRCRQRTPDWGARQQGIRWEPRSSRERNLAAMSENTTNPGQTSSQNGSNEDPRFAYREEGFPEQDLSQPGTTDETMPTPDHGEE